MKKIINSLMILFLMIGLTPNVVQTFCNEITNEQPVINYEIKEINEEKNNISFILNENTSFLETNDFKINEIKDLDTNTILTSLDYEVDKKDEYHFLINYVNSLNDINNSFEVTVNGINKINQEIKTNQEISTYSTIEGFDELTDTFTSTTARDNYIDTTFEHYQEDGYEIIGQVLTNNSLIIIPNQYQGRQIKLKEYSDGIKSSVFGGKESYITKIIFETNGSKVLANPNSILLFGKLSKLTEIKNLRELETSQVTTMYAMFGGCSGITSIDVRGFDTSKVKDMNSMFALCSGLTSIDVRGFDTSKVEDMFYMFSGCSGLISIDVSGFVISEDCNMNNMFDDMNKVIIITSDSFNPPSISNTNPLSLTFNGINNYFTKVFYTKSEYEQINNLDNLKSYANNLGRNWVNEQTNVLLNDETKTPLEIAGKDGENYIGDPIVQYTITYNNNGGEGVIEEQIGEENTQVTLSNNKFTKQGYQHVGWNTQADGNGTSYNFGQEITITQNLELFAKWEANTYTITYKANGGVGEDKQQSFTYGTSQNLMENPFIRQGYRFVSWNTQANGEGESYIDQQNVENLIFRRKFRFICNLGTKNNNNSILWEWCY